jgi:hypothetical protein
MRGTVLALLVLVSLAAGSREPAGPASASPRAAPAPEYEVGERLKPAPRAPGAAVRFREIDWDELMPPSWNPQAIFDGLSLGDLRDGDPRAMRALERLRAEWERAPANRALNGAAIRIAGFLVPLERTGKALSEFLLVPYFGACIHVPPPPANQIIHVVAKPAVRGTQSMDAVWVEGIVETGTSDTPMGRSSYRMKASRVQPYGPTR